MKTRLYAVKAVIGNETREFLVDATQKGTASNHVAAKFISSEIADGRKVAALMDKGIKIESASAEPGAVQQGNLPGTDD